MLPIKVGKMGVGKMGVSKMGVGKIGVGKMGVGEQGISPCDHKVTWGRTFSQVLLSHS